MKLLPQEIGGSGLKQPEIHPTQFSNVDMTSNRLNKQRLKIKKDKTGNIQHIWQYLSREKLKIVLLSVNLKLV